MARLVLAITALVVPLGLAAAEPPAADWEPVATIMLVGNIRTVEPAEVKVGGKKGGAVPFQLVKGTPLVGKVSIDHIAWLRPEADIKPVHKEALKRKKTYFEERMKAVTDEKDESRQIKLAHEYALEMIHPPPFVVIEGRTVGVVEREFELLDKKYPLRQVVIAGKGRVLDAQERQKWQAKSGVVVEGVAPQGQFVVGKETYSLGVKNGKLPIVLTGKMAKEQANVTGTIRVTGELLAEKDRLLLTAEAIEAVKKNSGDRGSR
jgi:hypothetical protein